MPTLQTILESFIDQTGIGHYGTLDSRAAGSITHIARLQNSEWPPNRFARWWIWCQGLTGDETVKPATTLATATLSQGATSYVNVTTLLAYRLLRPDWHPTLYVLPLVNRALLHGWQWWRAPLTLVSNGDGEATTVGGSDSNATATRTTTAANVYGGASAINVANSAANGYHQYATFDAARGRAFRVSAWVRITAGTARIQIIDVSNANAVIEETTVTGVGEWRYVQMSDSFPSTCYRAAIRVGADDATGDTNWDDVDVYWEPITQILGPSWVTQWLTEENKPAFRLLRSRNRLVADGNAAGLAYNLELIDPSEYQVLNMPSAANPVVFELGKKLSSDMGPIIIEARRPFSDFGVLALDADTTGCPTALAVALMRWLAAKERGLPNERELRAEKDHWQSQAQPILLSPPPDNSRGGFAYEVMG